jgi:hypothetical protein
LTYHRRFTKTGALVDAYGLRPEQIRVYSHEVPDDPVPVRVSHLHYLTNDEREESDDAENRARLAIELLRQRGVAVTGGVGSDDPLESMTDALGSFAATRVLLATSTEEDSYWMEQGLVAKARSLTPLQVDQVVVPPTPSTDRGPLLTRG